MSISLSNSATRLSRSMGDNLLRPNAMFCATERCGNSAASWGTTPTLRSSAETLLPEPKTLRPAISIWPLSGESKPEIRRSSVVFPDPLLPRIAMNSCSATSRLIFLRTGCPAKSFLTCCSESTIDITHARFSAQCRLSLGFGLEPDGSATRPALQL